jgi:hypothetical protein
MDIHSLRRAGFSMRAIAKKLGKSVLRFACIVEKGFTHKERRCSERIREKLKRDEVAGFQPMGQSFRVTSCDLESLAQVQRNTPITNSNRLHST